MTESTDARSPKPSALGIPRWITHARSWWPILFSLLVLSLGLWWLYGRPTVRAERWLQAARRQMTAGEFALAEDSAFRAWQLDHSRGDAAWLAAEAASIQGASARAVEHARRVASDDRRLRQRALLLQARLCHEKVFRFSEAEAAYREILALAPEHLEAHRGLAELLLLCGRRREAVPHILMLVRHGELTELLVLLAREDGVITEPEWLARGVESAPHDPLPLLGQAWSHANAGQLDEALFLLKQAVKMAPELTAGRVMLGQRLAEAGQFDELLIWSAGLPEEADAFAETWLVRAWMAEHLGDRHGAIRCYGEAARRAPENRQAASRLAQLLALTGEQLAADQFTRQVIELQSLEELQNRILFSAPSGSIDPVLEMVQQLERLGRLWEAYAWCRGAVESQPRHPWAAQYLDALSARVSALPTEFPMQQTIDAANPALQIDLSQYPLPRLEADAQAAIVAQAAQIAHFSFRDDAQSVGLSFRYLNGTSRTRTRRMYEFSGGGVAVLDYDRDGLPDVYFTQGSSRPPWETPLVEECDQLFRNVASERFHDITHAARVHATGFGQGVTVGDVNADGFPDLYVANAGNNQLWINQGDGTFLNATWEAGLADAAWTTSCLLADLSGDGLPDLYDVNYLTGPGLFERVCASRDGEPRMCMPFDFDGELDRLWVNQGNGTFRDGTGEHLAAAPDGKGLGIAAWDATGDGRLSILVANDTTANFYFVPAPDDSNGFRLVEQGILSGLAFNHVGKPEGCMGIALGDIDGDGRLDVHVTNFLAESNTLYLNPVPGIFEDRTLQLGLQTPTLNVLGFGTQFLDVDQNGTLELFVANGHIDDLSWEGKPFRMPPQLFRREPAGFREVDSRELGGYFQQTWLGRAVVRLDWNRDGREDLIIGHLEDEIALLTNTTLPVGQVLDLSLFGVHSNRDAIGTIITVRAGDLTLVRQLTAGDGYHASNERKLMIGVGPVTFIDELLVQWPSGLQQSFREIPVPVRLLLREGGRLLPAP